MIEIIIVVVLGIMAGIITGLIPGVHINLISLLIISFSSFLLGYLSVVALACFIIAMAVTHTFLDSIPSIFLGAPEADTILGVLPGHRYLLRGWGYMAVKLTVIGSFSALILSIGLLPILIPLVSFIYPILRPWIGYLLLIVVIFMILREKHKFPALLVFLASGSLGYIVLNTYNIKNPLFPMLSGLFGVATLLFSLRTITKIPPQDISPNIKLRHKPAAKAVISSTITGFFTSMFPGIGAAQGAVIAMQFVGKIGDHGFMILLGGINTVNFVLSLVTLFALGKARNGAILAVQDLMGELTLINLVMFACVALIAGGVASWLALFFGRLFSRLINKVDYKKIVIAVVVFIIILTIPLSGFHGLLILFTATFLGFIPPITGCSRTHAMGCLLLPVILYFL